MKITEKQGWAEQAKMRANKTAASYNEYVLKNSYGLHKVGNNKGVAMTKEEANELYEKFRVTGHEAFSLHEIWLMIFWNGKNPREFDKQDSEH